MDNISRDNSNSLLPMAGVIVGVIAIALSIGSLVKASKAATAEDLKQQIDRIDTVEAQARAASDKADKAGASTDALKTAANTAFQQYSDVITKLQTDLKALQEARAKPVASSKGSAMPAVAGKGEYIVKAGDTGGKIAAATGFSVKALEDVNPGIEWTKLKVGQKLKLPEKQ